MFIQNKVVNSQHRSRRKDSWVPDIHNGTCEPERMAEDLKFFYKGCARHGNSVFTNETNKIR